MLRKQGVSEICVDDMCYAEQAAEGTLLAAYNFKDINDRASNKLRLELYNSTDMEGWTRGVFKAEAQNMARKLTEFPSNIITPTGFAQAALDLLSPCDITVEVRTLDWLEHSGMNSILSVARGSCEPPILLEISYCAAALDEKPLALLGKGFTFNSGGIHLKNKDNMDLYRGSMAGAAIVLSVIRAAAALSLPLNIIAVIPLCENMPSGMSIKAGDLITNKDGRTIAFDDPDKAGVVMMTDPLIHLQNFYSPKLIIDVACLGNGIQKVLGGSACGLWSSSNYIWKQFQRAGAITGDRVWRMPLWNYYTKKVTNNTAFDISNKGKGFADSCLSAAILNEYIQQADWVHLDIMGVGMETGFYIPYLEKNRMTGRPTRTIIQFLHQVAYPEEEKNEAQMYNPYYSYCNYNYA